MTGIGFWMTLVFASFFSAAWGAVFGLGVMICLAGWSLKKALA